VELISGAVGTSQAEPAEVQDAFEVGEEHLHLLPLPPGGQVGVGLGDVASDVPGPLVD
jgi:hypothetical protein